VAKLAGVSSGTVSKYFNNPHAMKLTSYQKVEDAVKKLNYTPNLLARNLRVNNSRTIAVIAQEITNPFHATLYNTIRKEAQKYGYSVVLYSASDIDGDLKAIFGSVPANYFSGVIIGYMTDILQSYDFAKSNNVPLVILSNDLNISKTHSDITSVYIDIKSGIAQAVEHLIDLGMRKIAFLGSAKSLQELEPKLSAFKETLIRYNIEPYHIISSKQDFTALSGYQSAKQLIKKAAMPDAIMVASDIMAIGAMRALAECAIHVPTDVLLVSCDDTVLSAMSTPAMTTVHLPIEEASKKAYALLMEQIEKKQSEGQIISFDTTLVVRETTRRVLNEDYA
jgi:DNA-binding LacI/PurR family transcriptional regulator